MMKFFSLKYVLLILLISTGCILIHADNYRYSQDECNTSCYECSCNPLFCGALDIQFQGGVAPILWRHRGTISTLNFQTTPPIVAVADIPRFSTFFKTPWTIGGQLGYAWCDNTRIYVEFDYVQARAKSVSIPLTNVVVPTSLTAELGKYRFYNFYIGARYYLDRWCDRTSLFVGGKIGATFHKGVSLGSLTAPIPGCPAAPPTTSLFTHNSVFSGGGNIGLDICIWGNLSFVITAEVVAHCGPKNVNNIVLSQPASFALGFVTNLLVSGIETEVIFPITFGLRHTF